MKKLCLVLACLFLSGCVTEYRVMNLTGTGEVLISAGEKDTRIKDSFDVYDSNTAEMPIARIFITRTAPASSSGIIVDKLDGRKIASDAVSVGMICRKTTKATLKAERQAYRYQKKALNRQYNLTKIRAKKGVYDGLDEVVSDTNEIQSIKAGLIKVEKK